MNREPIANLEGNLRGLIVDLQRVKRWGSFTSTDSETTLEHTFKCAFLMQIMIAIEKDAGNPHKLDFYDLLTCAFNHDFGEAIYGDVPLEEKTPQDENRDARGFDMVMRLLVPEELQHHFKQPLDRREWGGGMDRMFFKAFETVGYYIYALEQTWRGESDFQRVVDANRKVLQGLTYFPSVTYILGLAEGRSL